MDIYGWIRQYRNVLFSWASMKFLPLRTKSDQNPYKTLIFLLQLCEEGKMLSGPIAVKCAWDCGNACTGLHI